LVFAAKAIALRVRARVRASRVFMAGNPTEMPESPAA
jgi:hypothetical protein